MCLKRIKDIPKRLLRIEESLSRVEGLLTQPGAAQGALAEGARAEGARAEGARRPEGSPLASLLRSSPALAPYARYLAVPERDADLSDEQRALGLEAWLASLLGRWEVISQLWELMAARCEERGGASADVERELLARAVRLHNALFVVTRSDRRVSLASVEVGERYDPRAHRAMDIGSDVVAEVWLPGVVGFGGELAFKSLVVTRR